MKKETKKTSPAKGSQEKLLTCRECLSKKVKCLSSKKGSLTKKDKAKVIHELRKQFDLNLHLSVSIMARSKYYYPSGVRINTQKLNPLSKRFSIRIKVLWESAYHPRIN